MIYVLSEIAKLTIRNGSSSYDVEQAKVVAYTDSKEKALEWVKESKTRVARLVSEL